MSAKIAAPSCPTEYHIDRESLNQLAEAITLAAGKLTDPRGLRVVVPLDFDGAWVAAHAALGIASKGLIAPVMSEGWMSIFPEAVAK